MHPADVEPDAQIIVVPVEIAEPLPLNMSVGSVEIREAHAGGQSEQAERIQNLTGCPNKRTQQLVSCHPLTQSPSSIAGP